MPILQNPWLWTKSVVADSLFSSSKFPPDFCRRRKCRILTRLKIRGDGFPFSTPKITFQKQVKRPETIFEAPKQVSNLKSVSKPVQSSKTSFKPQISFQSQFKASKPVSNLKSDFKARSKLQNNFQGSEITFNATKSFFSAIIGARRDFHHECKKFCSSMAKCRRRTR